LVDTTKEHQENIQYLLDEIDSITRNIEDEEGLAKEEKEYVAQLKKKHKKLKEETEHLLNEINDMSKEELNRENQEQIDSIVG